MHALLGPEHHQCDTCTASRAQKKNAETKPNFGQLTNPKEKRDESYSLGAALTVRSGIIILITLIGTLIVLP